MAARAGVPSRPGARAMLRLNTKRGVERCMGFRKGGVKACPQLEYAA
jgi:hypothetical protein